MAGSRGLALGLVITVLAGGCSPSAEPGNFEDDLGTGEASPPDLPQPECDPRRLAGCKSGLKCVYVSDPEFGPTTRCVELKGDGLAGELCHQIGDSDDCANHHMCWALDEEGVGMCVSFCSTMLTCEDEFDTCTVSNNDLLSLCLPKCDPVLQNCAPGWGCYADDYDRWACDTDRSGAGGAHGEVCDCLNCCDPGLICLPGAVVDQEGCGLDDAAGCCAQVCELDMDGVPVDPMCPTELEQCEAFYSSDMVLMGYGHVGICRL